MKKEIQTTLEEPCMSADKCKFNWNCVGEGSGCPIRDTQKYLTQPQEWKPEK